MLKRSLPLLITLLLAACGPTPEQSAATITQLAEEILASQQETQTAEPVETSSPIPSPTPAPDPASEISFYLREGPDYTYPAFDVVPASAVSVTAQFANCLWLKVIAEGQQGWISNRDSVFMDRDRCEGIPTGTFRLFNGSFLLDRRLLVTGFQSGPGELSIQNNGGSDALVVVADLDGEAYITFYVQAEQAFTLQSIPDGIYSLYVSTGEDWDPGTGLFTSGSEYFRFEDPLEYTSGGVRWTVTLDSVEAGNAPTDDVSPDAFPH